MPKIQDLAAAFVHKTQLAVHPAAPPISSAMNAFNALFAVGELNDRENKSIERILFEGSEGSMKVEQVDQDVEAVKQLTKELMAIKRQEMVLIGERIAQARQIFQKYKDRSFREWLNLTFGSFKTGYNYLSFYDLYLLVPDDIKARLKEMPAKAVYILASKKVPVERKIKIVKDHAQETAQNLIALIQNTLGDRPISRRPTNERLIRSMEKEASTIVADQLDASQKQRLIDLVEHLKVLIAHSK